MVNGGKVRLRPLKPSELRPRLGPARLPRYLSDNWVPVICLPPR